MSVATENISSIDDIDAEFLDEGDYYIFYSLDGVLSTDAINKEIETLLEGGTLSSVFHTDVINNIKFDVNTIYGLAYITTKNNHWTYATGSLAYLLGIRYAVLADDSDEFDMSMGLFTLDENGEPEEVILSVTIGPNDQPLIGSTGTHSVHMEISSISQEINHPDFAFEA